MSASAPCPSHPTASRGCSGTLILHSFSIFSPPLPSLTCFLVLHQLSLPWVSLPLCLHWLLSRLDRP